MAELKTKLNNNSVDDFLKSTTDGQRLKDCQTIVDMMKKVTKFEPKMWGTSIIGFGSYHYIYDSGHEGDAPLVGFSPRKQNLTLYLMGGFNGQSDLMKKLGKYKTGKGCLYINNLEEVNLEILKKLVVISINGIKQRVALKKKEKK